MRLVTKIAEWLSSDKSVRLIANDEQIAGELILLVRVIYADGMMRPEEKQCFKEICINEFGIPHQDLTRVFEYLRDIGHEMSLKDAASLFKGLDKERKKSLLMRMYDVAKSDNDVVLEEYEVIRHTAEILGMNTNYIVLKAA